MERDVPSITTATRSLARSLKQFRSNRLQKPRWLSAAEHGDLEFIQKRLREGQDIEVAGDWGRTALWTAVRFGQTGVVAQPMAARPSRSASAAALPSTGCERYLS